MTRPLFLILIVALSISGTPAQDRDASRPFLHRALLDRADVIVRARLVKSDVLAPLNISVTEFRVSKTLKGTPQDKVLVGAMGERSAALADVEKLLFLKALRSGRIFELVDVIDLTATEDLVAPVTIAAYLGADLVKDPAGTARKLKDLSFRNLDSTSVFGARTAVYELDAITDAWPQVLGPDDLSRLERLRPRVPKNEATLFASIEARLGKALGLGFQGADEVFPEGPERDAFRRALGSFRNLKSAKEQLNALDTLVERGGRKLRRFTESLLEHESPQLRSRAAWYLGEFAEEGSAEGLVRGLKASEGLERLERITALGKIGRVESVVELRGYLEDATSIDGVVMALARIGGHEAADLLERLEARWSEMKGEEERVERIRHYRSPDFGRQEALRRLKNLQTYGNRE